MNIEISQKNTVTGEITRAIIPGKAIGAFYVHMTPESEDGEWTVTHAKTGYAIQRMLPSKARADWLARKLSEMDVWSFTNPEAAKEISKEDMAGITALRFDAMNGDCQGEIDD